jgi:hypothetical protein
VFAWFNVDLRGFDAILVQHTMKISRQKQKLVNFALKATFRRELGDLLRNQILFLVHHEGVSKWEPASKTPDNFRTFTSLRTFRQAIIRNPLPPFNMGMLQKQIVELYLETLLDSFLGYNKIKGRGKLSQNHFHY